MEFGAHGTFELSKAGEVYLVSFSRAWNVEASRDFFSTYVKFVEGHNLPRFGVLADVRELEGGTPEAILFFDEVARWATQKGQVARAVISNAAHREYIVQSIDGDRRAFPVKVFQDRDEALAWLRSFGLSVS